MSKKKTLVLDEHFYIEEDALPEIVDFRSFFESQPQKPVQIEIGSGRGTALLFLAKNYPDFNFIGIEWAMPFYRHCVDRLRRWNQTNAKMLRTDARDLFIHRVAPETINAVHIYFPDPWPKKRHHKRRLVNPDFCHALARALVPGAKVYVASDHKEYFDQMELNLRGVSEFEPCEFDSPCGSDLLTNYEVKFASQGVAINRFAVRKK